MNSWFDTWLPDRGALVAVLSGLLAWKRVLAMLLALTLAVSAVLAAWSAHRTRLLYAELDALHREQEQLVEEQGQLLLERSALSSLPRVEQVAISELGMVAPSPEQTRWVTP